ncbi:hypothetical protein BOX15_Mlig026506g3, partial [Macrostomum lignano]
SRAAQLTRFLIWRLADTNQGLYNLHYSQSTVGAMLTGGNSNDEASGAIGCVADDCYDALGSDSVSTPSEGSDSEIRKDDDGAPPHLRDYCSVTRPELPQLRLLRNQPPFGYSGDPQMSTKLQSNLRDLIDGGGDGNGGRFWVDPQMSPKFQRNLINNGGGDSKGVATSSRKCRKRATSGEPGVRATYQAADVAGNRGQDDIDSLISFIEGPPQAAGKKAAKKKSKNGSGATKTGETKT